MSQSPWDLFTYQLINVEIVDEEYIILEVFHGSGEFASRSYRNEIHFKSKVLTSEWIAELYELGEWPPISIELVEFPDGKRMIISQGEYVESQEMLCVKVYYYEEKHIPLDPLSKNLSDPLK
jgi:hypothetical protein